MKRSDGYPVCKVVPRRPADGHKQHVHTVIDGCVEGSDDVGVEAQGPVLRRPANLIRRQAGMGRPALGSAVSKVEEAGSRRECAAGCGEGVSAVSVDIPSRLEAGVPGAYGGHVALFKRSGPY